MTQAGIEPVTFRFVAQHLNHCATAVPNQGMYNLKFTVLIYTNNTSNYQSTNETHTHTQENTTITTHEGSQLLILIETRYQLQPSDKVHH